MNDFFFGTMTGVRVRPQVLACALAACLGATVARAAPSAPTSMVRTQVLKQRARNALADKFSRGAGPRPLFGTESTWRRAVLDKLE